jgi:hypothetical protein
MIKSPTYFNTPTGRGVSGTVPCTTACSQALFPSAFIVLEFLCLYFEIMRNNNSIKSAADSQMLAIDSLDEHQLRQVLRHITLIHPAIVGAALANVIGSNDETSVDTEQMSNLTETRFLSRYVSEGPKLPSRTVSKGEALPPKRIFRDDEDDAVTIIEPETMPSTIGRPYSKGKSTEKPSPESVVSLSRPKPSRGEPSIGDLKPLIQAHEDELLSENILPSPASESISASPSRDEIACYLVYEPGSSGKLILHYSEISLDHAIGKWVPGPGKKIQGFKVTQNSGRSDLIGNCAGGVSGRKNYCSGWCQFVRSAKALNGTLTLLEETGTGLPVDVYFYFNGSNSQTVKLLAGVPIDVSKILAVACLPKHTSFYTNSITIDMLKWLGDANGIGASSMM